LVDCPWSPGQRRRAAGAPALSVAHCIMHQ
jgi:hypothetical protein